MYALWNNLTSGPLGNVVAVIWGFCEATFFFIVPDVWTSFVGRKKLRAGLIACAFALVGALAGGWVIYTYGQANPDTVNGQLARVPGISESQIAAILEKMSAGPYRAMLTGPAAGNPYKIYAANFHRYDDSLGTFLLATIPARLIRFLGATVLIHFIYGLLLRAFAERTCRAIFATGWIAFYIFYFSMMGW